MTDLRALVVPVGGERYAVRLDDVREVAEEPRLTKLPDAPRTLLGIVNLHGAILPLMDTSALLGGDPLEGARWAVVADTRRGPVALAASGFPAIRELEAELGPAHDPRALGRFATSDGTAVLLDVDALVES